MSEHITVRGFVATEPQVRTAQAGFSVGNFRLAATDRRFDREVNAWVDGQTNWFTVNMFRTLALNAGASLEKGQPVIVTGRLKVRPWESGDRSGTAVEIEADSIGHDLALGTARYSRSSGRSGDGAAHGGTGPSEGTAGRAAEENMADVQTVDDAPVSGGELISENGTRVNSSTGEVIEDHTDGSADLAEDEQDLAEDERDLAVA